MKTIFTIARVKDESDIIESFCRYNLTYCDGMMIYDNGSFDNTKEIIQNMMDEGLPIYWAHDALEKYPGRQLRVAMSMIAFDEHSADLIVPLDADEFLCHVDGINPRKALEAMCENIEYHALWRTYVYEKEPDISLGFMPNNFTHYRNPVMESPEKYDRHKKVIVSRYLLTEKQARFIEGAHFLVYPDEHRNTGNIELNDKIVFAHFPIRSKSHIMRKVIPNWIHKWSLSERSSRDILDVLQLGVLFNHLKRAGEAPAEELQRYSLEYALFADFDMRKNGHIFYSREDIDNLKNDLGSNLTVAGALNTSFCSDKLSLRYTDFREDNKAFIRAVLKEVDDAVMNLSSESNERAQRILELTHITDELTHQIDSLMHQNDALTQQRDALVEQNGELTHQRDTLTHQRDDLVQHNYALTQHRDELELQITNIYNSNTWKIGKRLQRMFRFFVPQKRKE